MRSLLQSARRLRTYPFAVACISLELLWATYPGMAVAVLFYESKGLQQADILLVQSTVALASMILVIPGGYLADKYGIRTVTLWANSLLTVQSLLFWLAEGYGQYQLLAPLSGAAWCMTGTLTSSLMSRNLSNTQHEEFTAWGAQARNVGIIGGLLVGGWLVSKGGVDLPFAVQPWIHGISVLVALRLPKKAEEPGWHDAHVAAPQTLSAVRTMSTAIWSVLRRNAELRWLILFFAVLHAVTLSSFWFFQPRLEAMGVREEYFDEVYIGRAVAALFLVQGVVWLSAKYSEHTVVVLLLGSITVGVVAAALTPGWTGMVIFIVAYTFTSGAQIPRERAMIVNRLPAGAARTTELSVPQAVNPLVFTALSWLFGRINDTLSVRAALAAMGLTALLLGGSMLVLFYRQAKR